ncbi:MAG: acyl-CoA reductase [Marinifilaceae bacterium]
MNITQRIEAFVSLGMFLEQFSQTDSIQKQHPLNKKFYDEFQHTIDKVSRENLWFTPEHVCSSILGITKFLQPDTLKEWIGKYPVSEESTGHRIAVIMAGNIPMVGFHDMLCVLMTGHSFVGKLSSKDNQLLDMVTKILQELNPEFKELISFRESRLSGEKDFEAIIATGSNNSARYFEAYFGKYPHIIRRNRNSIAVISGNETKEELEALGRDIFLYFGLGCRNVSKLLLPENYDFNQLFPSWEKYAGIIDHNKYANNYDYNKSLFLMNQEKHFDNGFVLLKENKALTSPIGVVFYEYYSDINNSIKKLEEEKEQIQCIVGNPQIIPMAIPYGKAQEPELWDYADKVDTMEFLTSFSKQL